MSQLCLELDMGRCLVKLTYVNEGDSFLSPFVYDQVMEAHVTLGQVLGKEGVYVAPNLTAVSIQSFPGNAAGATTFIHTTQMKGVPVYDKFTELFIGPTAKRASFMTVMKLFRLLQPAKVAYATEVSLFDDIGVVLTIPCLASMYNAMLTELPTYITLAADVREDVDLLVRSPCLNLPPHHPTPSNRPGGVLTVPSCLRGIPFARQACLLPHLQLLRRGFSQC